MVSRADRGLAVIRTIAIVLALATSAHAAPVESPDVAAAHHKVDAAKLALATARANLKAARARAATERAAVRKAKQTARVVVDTDPPSY